MPQLESLLDAAMAALAATRPVFHSEPDFQLALAWQFQRTHPSAALRLEQCVLTSPRVELDVLAVLDGRRYGIELKYPRRALSVDVDGERYELHGGADDTERYDVWRDVTHRPERSGTAGVGMRTRA